MSDFCAPILQKLDYENIWAEPFLLATYIIDSLATLLILVGLILLACQNKLKGDLIVLNDRNFNISLADFLPNMASN